MSNYTDYSLCESVTATSTSYWHLRRLTGKGKMFGGGANTKSLCNREMSWDLKCTLTPEHLGCDCPACLKALAGVDAEENSDA